MIYNTKMLVKEIEAILNANSIIDYVSTGALTPLPTETEEVAVYISVESVAMEPDKMKTGPSGYDRHLLVNLYCNVNCNKEPLRIYDVADSVEACLLKDTKIWSSLVDRDIVAVEYDAQEHYPKRGVVLLLDIRYRLAC